MELQAVKCRARPPRGQMRTAAFLGFGDVLVKICRSSFVKAGRMEMMRQRLMKLALWKMSATDH